MWETIKDFPKYEVSNCGKVRNKGTGIELVGGKHTKGYWQFCLIRDGEQFTRKGHILVGNAFIPNPNKLPQLNHKDEDKLNNNDWNLEWCDNDYNMDYSAKQFTLISPDGVEMDIRNMTKFCKANNLTRANIHKVLIGERKHHKGWTRKC